MGIREESRRKAIDILNALYDSALSVSNGNNPIFLVSNELLNLDCWVQIPVRENLIHGITKMALDDLDGFGENIDFLLSSARGMFGEFIYKKFPEKHEIINGDRMKGFSMPVRLISKINSMDLLSEPSLNEKKEFFVDENYFEFNTRNNVLGAFLFAKHDFGGQQGLVLSDRYMHLQVADSRAIPIFDVLADSQDYFVKMWHEF